MGKGRAREMAEEALGLLKQATAILQVHTLIKKKTKFSSGNSDGSSRKVIYEEGLPNIMRKWANV